MPQGSSVINYVYTNTVYLEASARGFPSPNIALRVEPSDTALTGLGTDRGFKFNLGRRARSSGRI